MPDSGLRESFKLRIFRTDPKTVATSDRLALSMDREKQIEAFLTQQNSQAFHQPVEILHCGGYASGGIRQGHIDIICREELPLFLRIAESSMRD